MVVDFLEQLSAAMPSTEGEVQGILKKKTKTLKKLELRLTNRTRLSNDGYAREPFVLLVYTCHLSAAGLLVPAYKFSQGDWVQASYRLVKTANDTHHPKTEFPAQFFRVADLAHEAIIDGLPATKRYRQTSQLRAQTQFSPQRPLLQGCHAV
jgi:hypothetical protein